MKPSARSKKPTEKASGCATKRPARKQKPQPEPSAKPQATCCVCSPLSTLHSPPSIVRLAADRRDLQKLIQTGDLALCRAKSLPGDVIEWETGEQYSHVGMLGWIGGDLMLAETIAHRDARVILFADDQGRGESGDWPGFYDIFRIKLPDLWDRWTAWQFMVRSSGTPYGWRHLSRYWLRRRLSFVPPIANSDQPRYPRSCSAQVHAAYRIAGGRPLTEFDCDVDPGDLAAPGVSRYLATMYPDAGQIALAEWGANLNPEP